MIERVKIWLRAIRVKQWTKNCLIPAAWFFAAMDPGQRHMTTGPGILLMLGMFGSFCLVSSAFYLLNDIRDIEKDRNHPSKKFRPIAAGTISIGSAKKMAAALWGIGMIPPLVIFCRHFDRWEELAVMLGYSLLQVCYTGFMKRVPYLDVLIVAAGFVLRAAAGTTALDVRFSSWLFMCLFAFSLFVALCKRRHEKLLGGDIRVALKGYDMGILDTMVFLSALGGFGVYVAYTMAPETMMRFHCGMRMVMTSVPVALGLARYLQLTYSSADVGRPEKLILSDRILQGILVAYVAVAYLVLQR